jgi:hypothetical protein
MTFVLPSLTRLSLRWTSVVLMTVPPCFHTSLKTFGSFISTWSCFSGSTLTCSSGLGGPGTCASALRRAICDHTAVINRNEMVTKSRSMNGIMLISESVAATSARLADVYATHVTAPTNLVW